MEQKNKTHKIGIDARMYGAEQTGIGNYIKNLINNLAEIDKKNQYIIFLLEKEFDKFNPPAENFKKVKVKAHWYSWREQIILPLQLLKERLDLIHFPHFNSPILYPGKSIVTIHDITPFFFPGHKMNSRLRRRAFKAVFGSSIRKAEKVIAVSNSTKEDVIKYFSADPRKIEVVYEGVGDNFKILPNRDKIKKDIAEKYGAAKPFIFYAGVWRNHKNVVGLIKAFEKLKNGFGLDIQLVLGGKEDPFYPEILKAIKDLDLEKDIICPGFIPEEELVLFYNACELFVIPSFYEGFGLTGLEAFACGAPVAASGIAPLKEILGSAAKYFDPHNYDEMARVMKEVLTDLPAYGGSLPAAGRRTGGKDKMVKSGLEKAQKYSWRKMAEETLKIYLKTLKKNDRNQNNKT
ncbi:glycosyltransferase family 4 protein [Patescibacteria group bacterium]|nr:glycosyltransferase family 4 protein [Patescibacteria group bacterium]MBU4000075.1 glycosyltransferase family 4 protein [Patescibacteria group bacterium]MBU4057065.1 glycosyltransferase family 4 protein [Patescibacteria group bacterium]MBU4368696.1 glycosyltransferase family 4 protein [Patescibacteria group bacterium]